eukprot:gnl/MRDRNA2_/MRDRNA2_141924_c0_seq1.p1 gnl/MRDRNA2_/MRDRNA2_141924_c0~~gnl/MRDRNA2_/MRDRNA2_141924_c0_seq1.p1  ORF type:complete len:419 (+),score=26.45 gnl/MRDRNA2_/MRDRNA2_141924_c0_seq1:148-1257(+)
MEFPRGYLSSQGKEAWPLVINLHGSGCTAWTQYHTSKLHQVPVNGTGLQLPIVVYPGAGSYEGHEAVNNRPWNVVKDGLSDPSVPDDVAFLGALLDFIEGKYCIDRLRVYSAGTSGGARMASKLACDMGGRVAATVAVGGIRFPRPCACPRSTPVLAVHSINDQVNPYHGGGSSYWQTGVEDALMGWAENNACRTDLHWWRLSPDVLCIEHNCSKQQEVIFLRHKGSAHNWDEFSNISLSILWFLSRHALPATSQSQNSSICARASTSAAHQSCYCSFLQGTTCPIPTAAGTVSSTAASATTATATSKMTTTTILTSSAVTFAASFTTTPAVTSSSLGSFSSRRDGSVRLNRAFTASLLVSTAPSFHFL